MPDWTYQTIFRPALMRLGVQGGLRLALGAIGALARTPGGRRIIQLMGHMEADPRLRVKAGGLSFPTRVVLGCQLDPAGVATEAFAEFGFGFLEVGATLGRRGRELGLYYRRSFRPRSGVAASTCRTLGLRDLN